MPRVHWLFPAVGSSLLWGMDYAVAERLLDRINPVTSLFYTSVVCVAIFGVFGRSTIRNDTQLLLDDPSAVFFLIFVCATGVFANYFTSVAIQLENATVVSMVEISYPLYVMIFSWIVFGQKDVFTTNNVTGGLLIIAGIWFLSR
jgi:drug/metabolite transporter (DMT)-like permease